VLFFQHTDASARQPAVSKWILSANVVRIQGARRYCYMEVT